MSEEEGNLISNTKLMWSCRLRALCNKKSMRVYNEREKATQWPGSWGVLVVRPQLTPFRQEHRWINWVLFIDFQVNKYV